MQRISKENYYLNIAQTVLERATCLRRVYGAIIVNMLSAAIMVYVQNVIN